MDGILRDLRAAGVVPPGDGFDAAAYDREAKQVWEMLDDLWSRDPEAYRAFQRKQREEEETRVTARRRVYPVAGFTIRTIISLVRPGGPRPLLRPDGTTGPLLDLPSDLCAGQVLVLNIVGHAVIAPPKLHDSGKSVLEAEKANKGRPITLAQVLNMELPMYLGNLRPLRGSARSEWALDVVFHPWLTKRADEDAAFFQPHFLEFLQRSLAEDVALEFDAMRAVKGGAETGPYVGGAGEKGQVPLVMDFGRIPGAKPEPPAVPGLERLAVAARAAAAGGDGAPAASAVPEVAAALPGVGTAGGAAGASAATAGRAADPGASAVMRMLGVSAGAGVGGRGGVGAGAAGGAAAPPKPLISEVASAASAAPAAVPVVGSRVDRAPSIVEAAPSAAVAIGSGFTAQSLGAARGVVAVLLRPPAAPVPAAAPSGECHAITTGQAFWNVAAAVEGSEAPLLRVVLQAREPGSTTFASFADLALLIGDEAIVVRPADTGTAAARVPAMEFSLGPATAAAAPATAAKFNADGSSAKFSVKAQRLTLTVPIRT